MPEPDTYYFVVYKEWVHTGKNSKLVDKNTILKNKDPELWAIRNEFVLINRWLTTKYKYDAHHKQQDAWRRAHESNAA